MPKTMDPKFYLKLSVEERLRLADEIIASLPEDVDAGAPLGPTLEEMQRRLESHLNGTGETMTWEELCEKLGWQP